MRWEVPLSDVEVTDADSAAVAVTNATAALHLALAALGAGPGDEVIVPALTFVASANAVLYTRARPVFAEVTGAHDLNVSPADIARRITPRTRAIMAVHYGGHVCDMPGILTVAERHGLAVVEDAAHAPGATLGGRKAGTFGDVGCFSFFANKNLTTAEGGMAVTDRDDLAERLRLMRSHGMTASTWDRHAGSAHSYDVVALGYNYRIDEIRSALGLSQLEALAGRNERRRLLAARYRAELSGLRGISIPFAESRPGSAHHIFPVLLDDPARRPGFIAKLKERGIQTSVHYPPVHLFDYYRRRFGHAPGDLPLTEELCSREVTLPLYPSMGDAKIAAVCAAVRRASVCPGA